MLPLLGRRWGMSGTKSAEKPSIVIRKEEVVEGGHHGGAWKVAYADFVTAMMAFFLLMWLLNATTEEQRIGLADYFSPTNEMGRTPSGFGAIFGGRTPNVDGALASDRGAVQLIHSQPKPLVDVEDDDSDTAAQPGAASDSGESGPSPREAARRRALHGAGAQDPARSVLESPASATGAEAAGRHAPDRGTDEAAPEDARRQARRDEAAARAERERRERETFEAAAQQIRDAVRADPALDAVARQLAIDITPEGLRIQILDEDKQPMFATGSAVLNDRARALLAKVAPVLLRLPQAVSISGYTDAAPFRGGERSNWDLSSERANATRRLLAEAGVPEARIRGVAGHADRDPLLPADPFAAANRRVAVTVLRDARGAPAPNAPPDAPRAARGAQQAR